MWQSSSHRCLANQTVTGHILCQALANEIQRAAAQQYLSQLRHDRPQPEPHFNPSVGEMCEMESMFTLF